MKTCCGITSPKWSRCVLSRPNPTILAFDTSAAHCAAALLVGGNISISRHEDMAKGQAERLFPMLENVLDEAKLGWADLDAIAVATGPGNFTGIRIGVSAARGLALSLGRPAIGVTLFEALAHKAPSAPHLLSISGPRSAFYIVGGNGAPPDEPALFASDALPQVSPDTLVIGAESREIAQRLGCKQAPAAFVPVSAIAHIAATRLDRASERPTPFYLRPPDAAPVSDPPPAILP